MVGGTRPVLAAALLFGLTLGGATAQEATPVDSMGGPPLPAGCSVVADGLLGPRAIAIAEDGTLYVSETGVGGDEPVLPPTSGTDELATPVGGEMTEGTPAPEESGPPMTRGYTGQVTMVSPDGTQLVLAAGFTSYSGGVGPTGIALVEGQVYLAVGGAADGAGIAPLSGENTVNQIDTTTGQVTTIAELGPFEVTNNPDGTDVNPNLYGLTLGADGLLYVADAGGNTIYRVDPGSGAVELVTVVPSLSALTGGTPPADPMSDRQPVPTSLAVGPDGLLQVALLSEGWPADAPSVIRLEADGTFTPLANGLTALVGLAIGPDGATYVSQLSTDLSSETALGNVLRINPDGTTEVVVDGLILPNGLAFDAEGNLYVATVSIFLGPDAPAGQVVRCEGIATADGATPVAAGAGRRGA